MSKRSAEDGGNGTSQPPIKKVHFEPHLIGPVSTLEEMDIKVLQFQNKKLAQRIEQRHRCEAELRARIEQLEKRQTQDDAVLCVVNRYWNLLNEDIRVLLQRFDAETADESENKNENEATTSFLMQLSTWDKEELDAQLANRVQVSKRAVAKVLQAFDRLQQRNDKIWRAIKGEGEEGAPAPSLDEVVRATNEEVTAENRRLQGICTTLQENHHAMTLRVAQLQDAVNSRDTENAELKNQIDDLQYELMKVRSRNDKLENHLAEAIEKLKSYHQSGASASSSSSASTGGTPLTAAAAAKLEDVAAELEEQRELANNRLAELDRLHRQHRDTLKEVEKLKMDAFDRLQQRNDKIWRAIKGEGEEGAPAPSLDEVVRATNEEVTAENRRLQGICTTLQENHHAMTLRVAQLQDAVNSRDTENAELKNQIDDLQYELMKVRSRNDKLENHLAEAIEKLKSYHQSGASASSSSSASTGGTPLTAAAAAKLEDVAAELEEQRELANNRLAELDRLHRQHRDTLKEVEKLKMDIRQLPESVIVETTEYKCLQSQFSVLYNESMQMKTALDETRMQLQNAKNLHMRQIEMMESEELARQKALRAEMIQLEDVLGQLRKEYEMLRIEFEQNLAANEQTGPINREMRHLITSLQNHNQQLKGEVSRYKRKYKDTSQELNKLRKETEEAAARGGASTSGEQPDEKPPPVKKEEPDPDERLKHSRSYVRCRHRLVSRPSGALHQGEWESVSESVSDGPRPRMGSKLVGADNGHMYGEEGGMGGVGAVGGVGGVGVDKPASKEQARGKLHEQEQIIKELKQQLKKAVNEQKELKLLLDMYKGVSKEQRDKVQLMAAERKARQELEDHRQKAKMAQESKRERRMADEDALRKIKQLEEQKYELQKQLSCARPNADPLHAFSRPFAGSQEEEALLNEMEVTGQAFEDMQEQNSRLIQQLREKDDANFKLMSERIKANSLHKLLREEKQLLHEKVVTRDQQIESMGAVARRLEEKERLLQATLSAVEKELLLRQQAMEMHKRKAIESAQSAADLKLHLGYYALHYYAVQSDDCSAGGLILILFPFPPFSNKEWMGRESEFGGRSDVKRKDAVLTKCFHVFCWDCLRTRYETRQRKCPKCNAAFGANDYHRLYLST
ncbi:E3 ubiquitin-protein ligase Bre1 [Papilio machaon]|uniref:E3 ubiquitin protein ligase n=1 Tax=Papilio machaon TaxID=76193 RepID=A0A194QMU3_PAPMA|nr:E3 ubiquitin-protein ligase Bre1 [Papilio machaon]